MMLSKNLLKSRITLLVFFVVVLPLSAAVTKNQESETNDDTGYYSCLSGTYRLLEGVPRISNFEIDIYKIPKGLSIHRANAYFIEGVKPETKRAIDYDKRIITLKGQLGSSVSPYHTIEIDFANYLDKAFEAQYNKQIDKQLKQKFVEESRDADTGLIPQLVFDLPALPAPVRKFIGDKPSRLSLTGSQKLTLSGSSTKRYDRRLSEADRGSDLNLEMRQDLNLQLRGTIGDKISVNVKHSSQSEVSFMDPSTIEIEYTGDEDEIIQSIKAGNISLSLTGSEFIRHSASSKGLFGVRTNLKLGDLSITAVASKEEAQKLTKKFTGTDAADSLNYQSRNFATRTHYYIVDPFKLYELYPERNGEDDDDILPGYENNAIKTDDHGAWMLQSGSSMLLPEPSEPFTVYIDRWEQDTTGDKVYGWEIGEEDVTDQTDPYEFEILEINTDYFVDFDSGILSLNVPVNRNYAIGVTYTQRDGNKVGGMNNGKLFVKPLRRSNQTVEDDTWRYQMRNIYDLNRRNVQNDGFRMNFFTVNPDGTLNYYIEESIVSGGIEYNEYLRLDTNGDGHVNGFDETVNLNSGFVLLPMIEPFQIFSDNVIYQRESFNSNDLDQMKIYMSIVGKVGRDKIELGQMNILPGSVRVVVDSETLQENVHYLVDYDFGRISFLTDKGRNPDSSIEINYEYRPLFASESKTLMGMRADWKFSEVTKLGGTFIYHSEKVGDRRPRIGNESRTLMMADIDGKLELDPPLFTKLVDMLPFIKTDAASHFSLSGEIAMTMPQIYGHKDQEDRKEAYLDDMEGNVDSYPLGLTRLNWSSASKPYNTRLMRARANWYNPDNVLTEQVYDPEFLTHKERKEKVQILTLRTIPPEVSNPNISNQYWGGIMRYLGNEIDFSDKKYLELLVRVDKYPFQSYSPTATIHIDLGDISEDFYVWNNGKGVLNTEDGVNGGVRDGILEPREDIGLDGIPSGEEGDDPLDKFSIDKNEYGDFPYINGSSGNGVLDTEDLNGNGALDLLNRYFQYSINLQTDEYESEYNGWRLYRIPINEHKIKSESGREPNLRMINFARVWLETDELTRVQIARLHMVGNKWQKGLIKDSRDRIVKERELEKNNESLSVSVIDNQNNREHYVSPPKVAYVDDGVQTLEQALSIEYNNLQKGHYGMSIKRFTDVQNLLRYGKIRYWVYLERGRHNETIEPKGAQEIVFRIGADSLNYYEIRYPSEAVSYNADGSLMKEEYWQDIEIDFSKLTSLKQYVDTQDEEYEKADSTYVNGKLEPIKVKVVGNKVTLTNIREVSVGLFNDSQTRKSWTGRLYVNDIRVADPYEDIGFAARTTLNTTFADFSTLNIGLSWKTQNFNTNTSRTASISNEETISFDITNRYNLHKFFPTEWGFNIPLTLMRNQSKGVPRYKANSDILREDITEAVEKEREKREALSKSAEISFSQTTTPKNKWLLYTVKNTTLRGNVKHTENLSATSADTTLVYSGSATYNLNLPKERLGFNLWKNYRINYFPHSFNNNATYRVEEPNRWRWNTSLDDTVSVKWTRDRYAIDKKDLTLSTTVNYDMTSTAKSSFSFSQKRDLMQEHFLWEAIPFGREIERDQNLTLNYNPTLLPSIMEISGTGSAKYRDVQKSYRDSVTGEITRWEFDGSVTRNAKINLRVKNRDLLNSFLNKYGVRTLPLPSTEEIYSEEGMTPYEDGDTFLDETPLELTPTEEGLQDDYDPERFHQQEMERIKKMEEEEERARTQKTAEDTDKKAKKSKQKEPKEEQILWAKALSYIARIDNLNMTFDNTYGTRYSKYDDRPDFLYQIGIPHQIADEKENLDMKENKDVYTVGTSYPIFESLTTTWNYSRTIDRRYSSASQKEITTVFPNVRVNLNNFEKLIRADKFMTSSKLSSSYTYTERMRGPIDWNKPHWDEPTARNITHSFSPLLSWQTSWLFKISSTVTYNHSRSSAITYRESYDAVQDNITNSVTTNLSWSFRSPQGLKIPFMKKRMPITNEMTTDLNVNWEASKSINEGAQETIVERDTEKYRINPRLTYNFSRNIKGGLQSSFENNHDKKRDEGLRVFSLSIWAEIIF